MWLEYGGLSVLTARLSDHRAAKTAVGCGLATVFVPSACVSPGRAIVTRCRQGQGQGHGHRHRHRHRHGHRHGHGHGHGHGRGQGHGQGAPAPAPPRPRAPARPPARAPVSPTPRLPPGPFDSPGARLGADLQSREPPRRRDRRRSRAGGPDVDRQQQQSGRTRNARNKRRHYTKLGPRNDDSKTGTGLRRPPSVKNNDDRCPSRLVTPGAHPPRS
jgi:hypothetical protein